MGIKEGRRGVKRERRKRGRYVEEEEDGVEAKGRREKKGDQGRIESNFMYM